MENVFYRIEFEPTGTGFFRTDKTDIMESIGFDDESKLDSILESFSKFYTLLNKSYTNHPSPEDEASLSSSPVKYAKGMMFGVGREKNVCGVRDIRQMASWLTSSKDGVILIKEMLVCLRDSMFVLNKYTLREGSMFWESKTQAMFSRDDVVKVEKLNLMTEVLYG